jgi:uncharacterized ion transporter superfamily protein YfcC
MWDWITDAFTISFGEALLENLFFIIVIYIISLGYLNYYINRYINKILESENENENENEDEDEEQRWELRGGLHVAVSFTFIIGSLLLMFIIFRSTAALAGYTFS